MCGNKYQPCAMARYGQMNLFSTEPINTPSNYVPLRSDYHKLFDERHYCFAPKRAALGSEHGQGEEKAPQMCAHVFNSTPSGQLPKILHNRRIHALPASVSTECLFVRFVWTIYSPTIFGQFLAGTVKARRLLVWDTDKYTVVEADPERCRAMFNAARSRSQSPQKRSRTESSGQGNGREREDVPELETDGSPDLNDSCEDILLSASTDAGSDDEEDLSRGRTMKRKADELADSVGHGVCRLSKRIYRNEGGAADSAFED